MNEHKRDLIVIALVLVLILSAGLISSKQNKKLEKGDLLEVTLVNSQEKQVKIFADVADNQSELEKGLSGRSKIQDDRGMIFIFPEENILTFWMKEMKFPLDMIFFDSQFNIVDINENAQPCKTIRECPIYPSKKPARYVLEINAGLARKNNLKIGDKAIV